MSLHHDPLSLVQHMTAAFQRGDIDTVMETYEPEARVVFEPGAPLGGDEALRAAFAEFAAVKPVFTYAGHDVVVAGDVALHLAPWTMTGTLPDGTPVSQTGLSVAVMRRQPDGAWRMVIDHPYGDHLSRAS